MKNRPRSAPGPAIAFALTAALAFGLLAGCTDEAATDLDPCEGVVVAFDVEALELPRIYGGAIVEPTFADGCGGEIEVAPDDVTWASSDSAVVRVEGVQGALEPAGYVQARGFGTATITAAIDAGGGTLPVAVTRPDTGASNFTVVSSGRVGPYTTDLWVHGDYAYSGSMPWSCDSCADVDGWLYVWNVAGGAIQRVDSLALPAAKINDIKVSADGTFAVASQERGAVGENGIVVLDLADPAAPTVTAHYTAGLEHGVHNVWIERIDGRDYVFTIEDGFDADDGLHVVDVTDRDAPTTVARFYAGSSFPHDVYVRDGLAFVSHWNAGLVILDVGNGMAGGAPDAPVEVSRIVTENGHVHNAWYWPAGQVVFVGEERFPPPERIDEVGVVHVVDVSDLTAPVEVATFGVPGATPHNFWVDEDREILFAAWYANGLRAIDVSGTLSGDLAAQGRGLGYFVPSGHRGAGSVWAPQLHDGTVFLSDIYNGLWAVTFDG